MLRREPIDGRDTILATLTPEKTPSLRPTMAKIMRHFKARAWISESDYELVRVEIEAIDNLSFGLGLLARVHKGTVATYQRRKVNNETWLPARGDVDGQRARPALAAPSAARRLRVLQLPPLQRGYIDDDRRAPLNDSG